MFYNILIEFYSTICPNGTSVLALSFDHLELMSNKLLCFSYSSFTMESTQGRFSKDKVSYRDDFSFIFYPYMLPTLFSLMRTPPRIDSSLDAISDDYLNPIGALFSMDSPVQSCLKFSQVFGNF